jgi:hypothetical protein
MSTATVTAFKFPTSDEELKKMLDDSDDKSPEFFALLVIDELVDKVRVDISKIPLVLSAQDLVNVWVQNATPEELVHEYIIGRLAVIVLRALHGSNAPMPDEIRVRLPDVPIDDE